MNLIFTVVIHVLEKTIYVWKQTPVAPFTNMV